MIMQKNFDNCLEGMYKNFDTRFKSDQQYLEALRVLTSSTNETKNRISFIINKILPKVSKNNLLDVGVGNSELTDILIENFNNIHLVEPSVRALESVKTENLSKKTIEKFNLGIENYKFPENYYDLVVNAQTLYHIPREKWKEIIEKSHRSLKNDGLQLIVINNGLSRSQLTKFFGSKNIVNIEKLIEECLTLKNASIEVFPSYEEFQADSMDKIISISRICLHDVNVTTSYDELRDYLIANYKMGNFYKIDFCQYFFLIKKNK